MTPRRGPAILAVDGGGSKVDAALVARDGRLLGAARWHGSTYEGLFHSDGAGAGTTPMEGIGMAVAAACRDAGVDSGTLPVADLGVFCLAGDDLPVDNRRIARRLRSRGWVRDQLVRNDTFAVLRAGTDRAWGVAVVCGAGLNCSGVAPDGRTVRFAALGTISGDGPAGGSWLGAGALGAAVRAKEGRGPRTSLERLVPRHFGLRGVGSVLEAVHLERIDEERLLELTPLVFQAAGEGDAVARQMVREQIEVISLWATAAIRRLRLQQTDVEVIFGGGVMRNQESALLPGIRDEVRTVAAEAQVSVLHAPPVLGTALLGLDHLGAPRSASARIRDALTHERMTAHTSARREGRA